jgi:hypothetical protein
MQVTPLLEMVNTEGHQFGYGFMAHGEDVPYSCFYTSNISLPRNVLGATPFDPNFQTYGWEDLELGYRLSLQGLRIRYNEKAKAEHLHPTSLKSFFQRQKQVGKAVHKFLALHPELASDKFMPSFQLPIWFPIGKVMISPFIPFLNYIDTLGIQLPKPLLRRILLYGFLIGVQEGSSEE